MTLQERIKALEAEHGSLHAVSRHTRVGVAYLYRMKVGLKDNPSELTLKKLGLKRVVAYELL